jgi:hypothetical protein
LTPLKFYDASYTTNLPGDTKYFLTRPSLAAKKSSYKTVYFSIRNHPRRMKRDALPG